MREPYSVHVNSKWNLFRKAAPLLVAGAALLGVGCGGVGASGSISPASFLLPGLGHNESQKPLPVDAVQQPASQTSPQVAAFSSDLVQ